MSFETTLRKIVDAGNGMIGAALMGSDGIPIEQVEARSEASDDVSAAGVEFGRILEEIRKASDSLSAGALEETVVSLARFSILIRVVDEETFLLVVLAPEANVGKARYLARRHLLEFREQL